MEDEEEMQSQASPVTGSPSASPDRNGRITVTVATAAPSSSSPSQQNNTLTLALPSQQQPKTATNGGGREDCWSEEATSVLIEAWGERYLELNRGNLKQNHWREVADTVRSREEYTKTPKTDIQCKNRIDTVKKKYKLEKAKIAAGGGPSGWRFFQRMDYLIGPTAAAKILNTIPISSASAPQKVPIGIPVVGIRSAQNYHHQKHVFSQQQQEKQKMQFRRRADPDSDSSGSEDLEQSPDYTDSLPPEIVKRPRIHRELNANSNTVVRFGQGDRRKAEKGETAKENRGGWGNSMRELTRAIVKFGEVYEQAETSKMQQVMEMEKQRMKFAKDLELQRMQFFMKTQVEISQMKHGAGGNGDGRRGGNNNHHHHNTSNNNMNNNNMNNNNDCDNHSDSTSN